MDKSINETTILFMFFIVTLQSFYSYCIYYTTELNIITVTIYVDSVNLLDNSDCKMELKLKYVAI